MDSFNKESQNTKKSHSHFSTMALLLLLAVIISAIASFTSSIQNVMTNNMALEHGNCKNIFPVETSALASALKLTDTADQPNEFIVKASLKSGLCIYCETDTARIQFRLHICMKL